MSARRRVALAALAVLGVLAALTAGPLLAHLEQRRDIAAGEARLDALQDDTAELEARIAELADPALVERLARADLGLVRPGEESYTVLPPPSAGLVLPGGWPFGLLEGPVTAASARP